MDYQQSILNSKKNLLAKLLPLEGKLRAAAILRNEYGGFCSILDAGENALSIVSEFSLAYPGFNDTNGEIIDPSRTCRMFEEGGARAISVLTEHSCFGGSMSMLAQISRDSRIPILARDWFTHPVEICQAIVCGADAVNLVVSALSPKELTSLYSMATGLGLDVMLEVGNFAEMELALDLETPLICINNCNPHTLEANLSITENIIDEAPASVTVLSSGGIATTEDALRMLEAGVNGIILNEPLRHADIPQEVIESFLKISSGHFEG